MKKILVPTDFSSNSKAGIRFAIKWCGQQKIEIVFVHVLNVLRLTRWSDAYFEKYAAKEKKECSIRFEKFITAIYRQMNVKPGKHSYLIIDGISADISLLDYCRKKTDINYICISTRGAGTLKRIFGTNTGNLITKSPVPVIAVPRVYRAMDVKRVMYATDLRNYSTEISKVIDFALPFKATIDALHFSWPGDPTFDEKIKKAVFERKYKYGLKVHFEKNDAVHSLMQRIQSQIRLTKPSVVIMFTDQKRTFFQKLFLSSKAEELSFQIKVPLLVFNKS